MTATTPHQFFDPTGANRHEVEGFLLKVQREVLDALLGQAGDARATRVQDWTPQVDLPAVGRTEQELIDGLRQILSQSMNAVPPAWAGHMDTCASVAGVAGEFASAAMNNNMLSVEMSPAFSRLEHALMREICGWFELGERAGGVMLSGGSLANLQAISVARNRVLGCQERGVDAGRRPLVFASEVAHTSVHKACMLLGLGSRAVVPVAVDGDSRMRVDDLVSKLEWCKEQGATAVCVVATAGTTTTGSVDPLRELAQACAEHGVWLHVDAAYGGALVLSRRHRYLLDGVGRADSVTFNPQKWLYVPKTCAMVLFKDAQLWHDLFRVASPYMSSAGDQVNLTEVSVQGTRHAEVLKLWLSLQHIGADLHERLIDRSMALATRLAELLQAVHGIEVLGRPQTNIVCFRVRSSSGGWDDTRTERVREHLLERAGVFCSMPTYAGGKVLRVVLLNPHTDHRFVEHLAHQVSEAISTLG